jgi:hypothetical protein
LEDPPKEVPCPEKATYGGGGGGVYFSLVLSDRLTDSPPLGYLALNCLGISLEISQKIPFVEFVHELFVLWIVVVLKFPVLNGETVLIEGDFAYVSIFSFLLLFEFFRSPMMREELTWSFFRPYP